MTIAIDFDGTIVEHRYPAIGREIPYAIETLKKLQQDRHKLILWTAREGKLLEDAVEFCKARGLEFYAVNSDVPDDSWKDMSPTRKLKVDMFIDDRNLGGLPDWAVIYKMVSEGLTYGEIISRNISLQADDDDSSRAGFFSRLKSRCSSSRDRVSRRTRRSRHHW